MSAPRQRYGFATGASPTLRFASGSRWRSWLVTAALYSLALVPSSAAQARPPGGEISEDAVIDACIVRASSGHPWLRQTLRALHIKEGGWIGAEVRNANGSHDLGPMKVNSWWAPRMARTIGRGEGAVRRWLRDDACFNVEAARWIFLTALADSKDFWRAVGLYHSPTRWRQLRYARHVVTIMGRIEPDRAGW